MGSQPDLSPTTRRFRDRATTPSPTAAICITITASILFTICSDVKFVDNLKTRVLITYHKHPCITRPTVSFHFEPCTLLCPNSMHLAQLWLFESPAKFCWMAQHSRFGSENWASLNFMDHHGSSIFSPCFFFAVYRHAHACPIFRHTHSIADVAI